MKKILLLAKETLRTLDEQDLSLVAGGGDRGRGGGWWGGDRDRGWWDHRGGWWGGERDRGWWGRR